MNEVFGLKHIIILAISIVLIVVGAIFVRKLLRLVPQEMRDNLEDEFDEILADVMTYKEEK